ncbi:MAG: hypothetical protein JW909_00610 [Planctomycetes bacterium]|nr:hypothetical protein [Planctomycetota bacterium]
MGDPEHAEAEHLYGDELLEKLKYGWAPLPNKTLFALVLGGLKIRMMRSMVTMVSIILAIAFLAYTGLANQGGYNLAKLSQKLSEAEQTKLETVAEASEKIGAAALVESLGAGERKDLAVKLGMGEIESQQAEMKKIAAPLRNGKHNLVEREKELGDIEADPEAVPEDLTKARADVEDARLAVESLGERKKLLEEQIRLGVWLETGAGPAGMEEELEGALRLRKETLVGMAGTPSRLNDDGLEQLALFLDLAERRGGLEEAIKVLREVVAQEKTKREASDLATRLRRAGINVQATLKGNPLDTWLIVMALLTCAVGIANAMLMSVAERFREIGTMKCLGALDSLVVKLFLLESGMLGLVGAGIGIVLGTAVAVAAAAIQFGVFGMRCFPLGEGLKVVGLSMLSGLLLAVIGAVFPALLAGSMKPVDALRVDE